MRFDVDVTHRNVGFVWNVVEDWMAKDRKQIQDCKIRRMCWVACTYGTTTIKGTERYDKDVKQVFDQ